MFNMNLSLPVEKEIEHARSFLNKTEQKKYEALLPQLIRCLYDIQSRQQLLKTHLSILEQAICQPNQLIFYTYAGRYVSRFSHYSNEAGALLLRLAAHKRSGVRYNVVTLMQSRPQEQIMEQVLKRACRDKSGKVREKVADVSLRLNYTAVLPLLEERYSEEVNEKTKRSLRLAIALLRDGYLLENKATGKVDLTIKVESGISGCFFDAQYLEQYSLDDIVDTYRNTRRFPWELAVDIKK